MACPDTARARRWVGQRSLADFLTGTLISHFSVGRTTMPPLILMGMVCQIR